MRLIPGINQILKSNVDRKWPESDKKLWWYSKLQVVRGNKLHKLSEAQNHRCCYCGRGTWIASFNEGGNIGSMATLEHVIARADGGTDSLDNLVMACHACNVKRGSSISAEHYWEIKQGLRPKPQKPTKVYDKETILKRAKDQIDRNYVGMAKTAWGLTRLKLWWWFDMWFAYQEELMLTGQEPVLGSRQKKRRAKILAGEKALAVKEIANG